VDVVSKVVSIQVGQVRAWGAEFASASQEAAETTAIFKTAVAGPVEAKELGLAGDQQADLRHHGGRDKAVLGYAAAHYSLWKQEYDWPELEYGGFGENLTIDDCDEQAACVGDVYRLGDALLQVSQPRQPCGKLNRRWGRSDLVKLVLQLGRSGWYFRVVQPGLIAPGDLELVERPHPEWTIVRCHDVFLNRKSSQRREEARELSQLAPLAQAWKEDLDADL
ncbi:MAG: MOSC domain-containing protein, partial [Planctomycetales bacterium]|nr:MOSC domain-containing protein [Planctomycetales bacterium]